MSEKIVKLQIIKIKDAELSQSHQNSSCFVSTVTSGSVQINPQFTVTCENILTLHTDDVIRLSLSVLS